MFPSSPGGRKLHHKAALAIEAGPGPSGSESSLEGKLSEKQLELLSPLCKQVSSVNDMYTALLRGQFARPERREQIGHTCTPSFSEPDTGVCWVICPGLYQEPGKRSVFCKS